MAYCCKRKVQKVLIGISVWIESTGDDVFIDDVNDWVAFATKNTFLQVAQKPEV